MTYRVKFAPAAGKALAKIDRPQRLRLQTTIAKLADDPRPPASKALVNRSGHFRLRVGDYRVIYDIRDHELLVLVIDIGHRSDIYRAK